jgi:diaminopimelate decarboxylase
LKEALAEVNDQAGLLAGLTIVLEPETNRRRQRRAAATRVQHQSKPETGDTWLDDAGYSLALSMAMYKWYYHLVSASRAEEPHESPFKVAGPLCDSGDVYFDLEKGTRLPNYRLLPAATGVGDVLALLNVGAYALDQASQYNGRPIPGGVMVKETGEVRMIRRAQGYEDLYAMNCW